LGSDLVNWQSVARIGYGAGLARPLRVEITRGGANHLTAQEREGEDFPGTTGMAGISWKPADWELSRVRFVIKRRTGQPGDRNQPFFDFKKDCPELALGADVSINCITAMNAMNDTELLQSFASGSEKAFQTLVERHLSLVLGTARRLTRDNAISEDVAQTVFILLAQKAKSFGPGIILSGWLYRTTRFVARRALTSEERRRWREQEAAQMQQQTESDPRWKLIEPELDEALCCLGETDRNAVVLRFFSNKPMREVGAALGVSEEAAKKRVARAVERLGTILLRRGKGIPAAVLAAGLSQAGAKAGNAALVSQICQAAALNAAGGAASVGSPLLLEVLSAARWIKIRNGLVGGAAAVVMLVTIPLFFQSSEPETAADPSESLAPFAMEEGPIGRDDEWGGATANEEIHELPLRPLLITVLDARTQNPVSGARLRVWPVSQETDFLTDREGMVRLNLPAVVPNSERMTSFEIPVDAEGYAQRTISWSSSTGHVFKFLSPEYTVMLEPGIALSGAVVDDEGWPLSGVQVSARGSNRPETIMRVDAHGNVLNPEIRAEDFSSFSSGKLLTDSMGRFQFRGFPGDLRPLLMELITPEGVHAKYRTPQGARLTSEIVPEVPFEDLRNGTARLVIPRGVEVEGLVVNPSGEPVPGATVPTSSAMNLIEQPGLRMPGTRRCLRPCAKLELIPAASAKMAPLLS
jgi:RNA polymerase sigma factor (sigma-70 family)